VVQINGKLTPMSGRDLAQFLRGLSSNDVETIGIIGTPGAKYDAEGNGGIINLRLRKDKRFGTNGSLSLGFYQGITPKGDASISLNHRDRKLNLFGSGSLYRGQTANSMHLGNRVNDRRYDQQQHSFWYARPNSARIGADYERPIRLFGKPKDSKLGAGAKFSDVVTDNTFNFFNVVNGRDSFSTDQSNTFLYRERIAAAYLNLNTQVKKLSLQARLHLEHTDSRGEL